MIIGLVAGPARLRDTDIGARKIIREGVVAFLYPWKDGDTRNGIDSRYIEGVLHPDYGFVATPRDIYQDIIAMNTPDIDIVIRCNGMPKAPSVLGLPVYAAQLRESNLS